MIRHSCIHHEHGIDYLIRVEQSPQGFHGHWSCQACGREGLGADEAGSLEEAVRAAVRNLRRYHTLLHRTEPVGGVG